MRRERVDPGDPGEIVPDGPLESAIAAEARDGRLSCKALYRIAEEQGVAVAEAGVAVRRLGIKVTACQLGCF